MIPKTLVTAFMAASIMAGSRASPCKVSSRTTDISNISETSSTATSNAAAATTETVVSTSAVSYFDTATFPVRQSETTSETSTILEDATITTDVTTTDLTSMVIESNTEASITSGDVTSTTISTTDFISSMQESSSETSSASTDFTTTAILTTTESISTAESTTTSTEASPAPTFLANGGFDDDPDTAAPWTPSSSKVSLSLSSTIKHDGRNAAELTFTSGGTAFILQELGVTPQADVDYPVSAWFRPKVDCSNTIISCLYGTVLTSSAKVVRSDPTAPERWNWIQVSHTCKYSQAQIDAGGLYLNLGFNCPKDVTAWIDSVTFGQ